MYLKCRRIKNALVIMFFIGFLYLAGDDDCFSGVYTVNAEEVYTMETELPAETEKPENGTQPEKTEADEDKTDEDGAQETDSDMPLADLTEAFDVILQGATKEFIAGYVIDESFLMWLDAQYGDEAVIELAACIMDGEQNTDLWYDLTGNSIHVLWLNYCKDTGFQKYQLENVYWKESADASETVLGFAGDFNFAENWSTTEYMEKQPNGIYDCFSEELLQEMQASDILLMNNEFAYSDRGTPVWGKDYTFRAKPEKVKLLSAFGADIVSLANNHVYDYGKEALLDTLDLLQQEEMPYLGAGENIDEASKIVWFVANGKKIAIVSATQIERSRRYTKEATKTEPGVLKTLNPEKFVGVIEEARKKSDYVIAVVHWGTEGTLWPDQSQRDLAEKFSAAGADAIIGGHPHRLQGADYVRGIPVAYSLGNFWFSDGTLYTTLAQIVIAENGKLTLRYQPCIQKELKTSLITDENEKEEFYHYLAAVSGNIGIDEAGNVYDKGAEDYPAGQIVYDSDTSKTKIRGTSDNEGNAIDIVGNLK